MKIKLNLIIVINIALITILIIFSTLKFLESNKKIVYVDNIKVFDNFNMTKEMKRVGEKEFNILKSRTDSLYTILQSNAFKNDEKKLVMQQFIQAKDDLEKFNQNFASEQSTKIWSRIHTYVKEFSKEKNYQLVIGDNKQNVLFADEKIDITNELLTYLNKKYEGL